MSIDEDTVVVYVCIALVAACIWGWGLNVMKFAQSDFKAPYTTEIIRGVSIAAFPIGVFIGYIDMQDEGEDDE